MITYLFTQMKLLVASPTKVIVGEPLQLSVAVTRLMFDAGTEAAQVTVTGPGHVTLGGTLSFTVMICAQLVALPQRSVALYLRVTVN